MCKMCDSLQLIFYRWFLWVISDHDTGNVCPFKTLQGIQGGKSALLVYIQLTTSLETCFRPILGPIMTQHFEKSLLTSKKCGAAL